MSDDETFVEAVMTEPRGDGLSSLILDKLLSGATGRVVVLTASDFDRLLAAARGTVPCQILEVDLTPTNVVHDAPTTIRH